RRADVDDLALAHERLHRLPDFVPWSRAIDVVHLIEVDHLGLHALQRCFARTHDVHRRETRLVRPVAHRAVDLRRQDDLLAPPSALREPAADDLLRPAFALLPAVHVRGVEEVDPFLERAVHDLERHRLGGLRTEVHRAETDATDLETRTAEVHVFHGAHLSPRS